MKLGNLVKDQWVEGDGDGTVLTSAVSGEAIASITSSGLDFAETLEYARAVGGSNLRRYTFHERGEMLKALAQYLMEHKREFYRLSPETGATRSDSWVDIEGGISTLFVFSSKGRREMPNDTFISTARPNTSRETAASLASMSSLRSSVPRYISTHSTFRVGGCSKSWPRHYLPACLLSSNPRPARPT